MRPKRPRAFIPSRGGLEVDGAAGEGGALAEGFAGGRLGSVGRGQQSLSLGYWNLTHSLMAAWRMARMGWAELVPDSVSRIAVSSAKAGEEVKVLWAARVGRTRGRVVLGWWFLEE